MHVVDPVAELLDERRRVEELVREVARVEVDPEALAAVDRVECLSRGDEVVRDLGRMHLEREANSPSDSKTSTIGLQRSAKSR